MNKIKTVFIIVVITIAIYACSKDDVNTNDANVIIPTWFSPDGDGIKDTWIVEDPLNLIDGNQFSAKIYDTTHKLVFSTIDKNKPWLGTQSDSTLPCDTGNYFYAVQYRYWSGVNRYRAGTVFLSRKNP
ncbi:MAG: gliding motility-associated C-terminal domain-containing protein [Bacteroidales bacterium]